MENKDRIRSYRNPHIDSMIEFYQSQDQWKQCGHVDFTVIHNYFGTNDNHYSTFTADMVPSRPDEIEAFTARLIEAGITEFIITEESTALMRDLIQMMRLDWVVTDTFEDEHRGYPIRGLKLKYFR